MTRDELKCNADYFECQEREELQHGTECDAVLALVESHMYARDDSLETALSRMGDTVTVDCFKRPEWTAGLKLHIANHVIHSVLDYIDDDEDFAHPDDSARNRLGEAGMSELIAACAGVAEAIAANLRLWSCNHIGSYTLTMDEVRELMERQQ